MYLKDFEYSSPRTVKGTLSLLSKYGRRCKILAGGHSLLPLMRLGLAEPEHIVDISRVRSLAYIKQSKGRLRIGALTRISDLESSNTIRRACPLLSETASLIADPQVRNMGTVGGNLAHGDPANDLPPAMLALGSRFALVGSKGKRRVVDAVDFFVDLFVTELSPAELLAEVECPLPEGRSGGAFLKFERKVGDFATVSVAAYLSLDDRGFCKNVGIGLGAVGNRAIKPTGAEEVLLGKEIRDGLITEAAQKASEECDPRADLRGSREFKLHLVRVLTKKAIIRAHQNALGGEP